MVVYAQNVQRCIPRDRRTEVEGKVEEQGCAKEVRELSHGSSCR